MYHSVLVASQLKQPPQLDDEDAFYEAFGTDPFAGIRAAFRAVAGVAARLGAFKTGGVYIRRKASVL